MYIFKKDDGINKFYKNDQPLLTPMGRPVTTAFDALAKRLKEHLNKYGEDPGDPVSIVAFHYAMIDFFAVMPREELEDNIRIGLSREEDWTFSCPSAAPEMMMNWLGLFGRCDDRVTEASEWLSTLSPLQLCAVCVIGKAMESVNIPYIVAHLEKKHLKAFAKEVNKLYPYVPTNDLTKFFENLHFYFTVEHTDTGPVARATKQVK